MQRSTPTVRIPALGSALAFGLALAFASGLGACKAKTGEVCRCASDCRDGLVCAIEGREVLQAGECTVATEIGHCVDDDSLDDEGGLGDMPIYDDMPSKRDLGGPTTDSTDSDSTDSTDTDSTDTDSTETDSTDSDSTDSTDTESDTTDSTETDTTESDTTESDTTESDTTDSTDTTG